MKRMLIMVSAVVTLATPAWGAAVGSCCACVADFVAQTSGPAPPPAAEAFFCRLVDSEASQDAFSAQCRALQGTGVCLAMAQSASESVLNCAALLEAESGIVCPAAKTVPVAGHGWLTGLMAALLATGAWWVRRQPRRARVLAPVDAA